MSDYILDKTGEEINAQLNLGSAISMPTKTYIDIPFPDSYPYRWAAPADGWVVAGKYSSATNQHLTLGIGYPEFNAINHSSASNQLIKMFTPIRKGVSTYISTNLGGNWYCLRFFYAAGCEPKE